MTVSTEINHEEFVGNGITTVFPYRFRILEASNMVVVTIDTAGNEITLVLNTGFTVSGAGSYNGGNVTLTAPLPAGWIVTLTRKLALVQETDLRNQGTFFAEMHENAFDYLTMLIQQSVLWSDLSLRRQTFLSQFFNAEGRRVSNAGDPILPQDLATKLYTDTLAQSLDVHTLRVPEASIPMLPVAALRVNKVLTFDAAGNPNLATPSSGSAADVLIQLAAIGINLPSMTATTNFDFNNFVFTSGANYLTAYNTWINPPAGVTYNEGTAVSITVDNISSSQVGLTLIPLTVSNANYRVFKVIGVGAVGSRVFTVRQDWNSAIPVPITGGGTGGNTPATGRTGLGLGNSATKDVGTTTGTVAAGDDSRFGNLQLFTILYPGGTPAAPLYITANQRVVVTNPFSGRPIACRAEVYYGTAWGEAGWDGNTGTASPAAYGTKAVVNGGDIVVMSALNAPLATSNLIGNGFQITGTTVASVGVRLVVWTID